MSPVDALGLLVPVSFVVLLGLEALLPARNQFPERRGWRLVGLGFLFLMGGIAGVAPTLIPADFAARCRLLDLTSLGPVGGFVVGWALYTLVGYAWHRANHASPFLWRT